MVNKDTRYNTAGTKNIDSLANAFGSEGKLLYDIEENKAQWGFIEKEAKQRNISNTGSQVKGGD